MKLYQRLDASTWAGIGWGWQVIWVAFISTFASRIYAYEPGLLYQMSFGSYFGEGIRYALEVLGNLIKTIKVKTDADTELLLVDDGSRDRTWQMISDAAKEHRYTSVRDKK